MNKKIITCIAALAAILGATSATAQLYKCKGPDGKVVYSDTRCEASNAGALKVNPNSTTLSERERAAAEEAAKAKEDAPREKAEGEKFRRELEAAGVRTGSPGGSAASPEFKPPYQMSSGDKERIRSLEMTASSQGATHEAKSAAQAEIQAIRAGRDAELSSDQRSQRESLRTDFSSVDAQKRRRALEDFYRIYR